jgi:DNA polymerase III subunit delta'
MDGLPWRKKSVMEMEDSTELRVPPRLKEWISRIFTTGRLSHAYLFRGRKGCGKRATALFFAQMLCCLHQDGEKPCGKCRDCRRVAHLNHPDVHWVAPEGMSLKIEQVRRLQKEFAYRGMETKRKVYVIESVEAMTPQAANSLLKFLEEPHPGTVALLLTENKERLLPTITSRCQEIHFPPPHPSHVVEQIKDVHGQALARAAAHISADADEAMELVQSEWFAGLKEIVIQLTKDVQTSLPTALASIQDEWLKTAKEKEQTDIGLDLLLFWYKDMLNAKLQLPTDFVYDNNDQQIHKQSVMVTEQCLTQTITFILEAKRKLHAHVHPQLLLEQLVVRIHEAYARPSSKSPTK